MAARGLVNGRDPRRSRGRDEVGLVPTNQAKLALPPLPVSPDNIRCPEISLYLQIMRNRTLLICLCAVLLLVIANAVAVAFLYSPVKEGRAELASGDADSTAVVNGADSAALAQELPSKDRNCPPAEKESPAVTGEAETGVRPETGAEAGVGAEAEVTVPKGPFEVRNCATGKTNSIAQKEDFALEMKDEKGTVLWTLPLPGPICGRVAQIDYFANRKLQYLFICGRTLYLVDRLGRIVKGFPVQLSSDVLLGPDAYDFSGGGRYNIMVLNRDGSIDMYNLKGEKPASWKSIRPAEAAIGLPELLEKGSRSWWVVRSSEKSLVYSFYGDFVKSFVGEPAISELK